MRYYSEHWKHRGGNWSFCEDGDAGREFPVNLFPWKIEARDQIPEVFIRDTLYIGYYLNDVPMLALEGWFKVFWSPQECELPSLKQPTFDYRELPPPMFPVGLSEPETEPPSEDEGGGVGTESDGGNMTDK